MSAEHHAQGTRMISILCNGASLLGRIHALGVSRASVVLYTQSKYLDFDDAELKSKRVKRIFALCSLSRHSTAPAKKIRSTKHHTHQPLISTPSNQASNTRSWAASH
eukprot:scaffold1416_cov78-Skeletonema_dohrnii-CCMP3373.AAC.1